jgi:hypothetical protein
LAESLSAGGATDKKGFNESRMKYEIVKGQTHRVEDITSTETQLIDDMKKVHGVLEELMRTFGYGGREGTFNDFGQVALNWLTKSTEEKCKLAYKNFCHEFNFFLKLRDTAFFDSTIRPLLQCKLEKTFVDYYLLDDFDVLIATYNTLESKLPPLNRTAIAETWNKFLSLFKPDE